MRKTISRLALAAVAVLLLGSCSEINERIDKLESRLNGVENETIASINSQIGSINSSIADLSAIRTSIQTSIQSLTSTVEGQKSDLAALEAADEALGGRIDQLRAYVNDSLKLYAKSDWVNATFSTLKQYEETCDTIAKIDARIGALDTKLSQDIANCKDTLTSWINAQFGSYYTIAQMDAMMNELKAALDTAKAGTSGNIDSLAAELAATKAAIDTAKAQVTREYEAAIDTAITKLDGKLSKALQEKIDSVNTAIAALEDRVKTLELQVYILAGRVTELEKRIQSVTIIPAFSDGRVEYENDTLYIDCRINPADAVSTLGIANFKILLTKVVTKADAIVTLPKDSIKVFTKDIYDGTVSIQANIAKIIDDLDEDKESLAVAVNVTNGLSDYTSKYLPLHIPVDSVVLGKHSFEIKAQNDTTLTATVYPANASNKDVIWTSTDDEIATVDANGKITGVAPGTVKIAVTTVNKERTDTCEVTVLPLVEPLPGVFSVSDTKKIQFSKGNLQATYSTATGQYTWDFAEHQYDYIGNNPGNTTINSQTDGAVVDLFGWSTGTKYGIKTSTNSNDYSGNFKDWGIAFCESQKITPNTTWYTLSKAEWEYLIAKTANDKRNNKYKNNVKVCDVEHCLVLAPDECLKGYSFDKNKTTYTEAEWAEAEAAGLVCLSGAGHLYRLGQDVTTGQSTQAACYWSSTTSSNKVGILIISISPSSPAVIDDIKHIGYHVRLVKTAPNGND